MTSINLNELGLYTHYVVVRTERANQLIKRDPREMPRRLRLLLLAVDGHQDLGTYAFNLKGFGDILELIGELIQMDMVSLVDPALARQRRMAGKSANYMALDSRMDDSRFDNSAQFEELIYGSTAPGSLDSLVGHAQELYPSFQPQTLSTPVIPAATQEQQVESLFKMLEAVRGERSELKQHLERYRGLKKASQEVRQESKQLKAQLKRLKITCGVLSVAFIACLAVLLLK
jgi:hypothetical protein